jgi:general secretion pathway protein J
MRRATGFTLVELLVAIFITTIVFLLGYGAINQAVKNREALQTSEDRLIAVQRAIRTLVQDFSQLEPRPARDPLGDGYLPAILADSRSGALVSFTRGGWTNAMGVQRSTLQRVRYVFEDATLRREYWLEVDATLDPKPRSRVLLDHVKQVKLRFMDEGHSWRDQWPPPSVTATPTARELRWRPIAVEITLELEDWGTLTRLVEVPG